MHATAYTQVDIWKMLEQVTDPEIPVLTIIDLGIVRHVEIEDTPRGQHVTVTITPTYSGCPAMDMIAAHIRMELQMAGVAQITVQHQLSPAWTTDWMSEKGKEKLREYGIAPPLAQISACAASELNEQMGIPCPRCGSHHTRVISHFGSTACKALHQCLDCMEPFDYFKCH